jgi:hypothetical protein
MLGKYPNILKPSHSSYLPAYEDGEDRVFWNVGVWNSDADYPTFWHLVILYTYPPMKMEKIVFRNVGI